MNTIKPPLRWVGGKFWQQQITDRVKDLYEPYRDSHIWIEPFVGGMGMTLQVLPSKAYLYDGNQLLIMFYQLLQDCRYDYAWVKDIPYDELKAYLNDYILDRRSLSHSDFVSVFLALNQSSFNGLWRVNSKGLYNVPQGKNSKGEPLVPQEVDLDPLRKVFSTADWIFQSRLFTGSLGESDLYRPVFFYADPPYVSTFGAYTKGGWGIGKQHSLISRLEETKAPCVLSEKYSEPLEKYLRNRGWTVETFSAKRSISCNGDRTKATEILAHINCKK